MHVAIQKRPARLARTFHAATNNLMVGLIKAAWDDLIDMVIAMMSRCQSVWLQLQDEVADWLLGQTDKLKRLVGA